MVSLAVHELSTNAFKYGALSERRGTIAIAWRVSTENDSRFDLEWIEAGGPPVEAPQRKGFGMRILERGIQLETGGRPQVSYDPSGFRYRLAGARHSGAPGDRARAA